MSLKQKISEKAKRLADLMWENTLEFSEWQRSGITEPKVKKLSPKYNGKWVRVDDVVATLDEAIIFIIDNLQKEAFAKFCKNPNKHDRYWAGQIDAFTKVLVLFDGEKK